MSLSMPAVIVLFVCKTATLPYANQIDEENSHYTKWQPLEWATEHSMMVCRRQEVQLINSAESGPAAVKAEPFTKMKCYQAGHKLGPEWDRNHRSSPYRFWKFACPVKIVNTITGEIIGWKLPECGNRDTVRCEVDTEI